MAVVMMNTMNRSLEPPPPHTHTLSSLSFTLLLPHCIYHSKHFSGLVSWLTHLQHNPTLTNTHIHTTLGVCACVWETEGDCGGWGGNALCIHFGNCCAFQWVSALGGLKLFSKCTYKVNCSAMSAYTCRGGYQNAKMYLWPSIGLHGSFWHSFNMKKTNTFNNVYCTH